MVRECGVHVPPIFRGEVSTFGFTPLVPPPPRARYKQALMKPYVKEGHSARQTDLGFRLPPSVAHQLPKHPHVAAPHTINLWATSPRVASLHHALGADVDPALKPWRQPTHPLPPASLGMSPCLLCGRAHDVVHNACVSTFHPSDLDDDSADDKARHMSSAVRLQHGPSHRQRPGRRHLSPRKGALPAPLTMGATASSHSAQRASLTATTSTSAAVTAAEAAAKAAEAAAAAAVAESTRASAATFAGRSPRPPAGRRRSNIVRDRWGRPIGERKTLLVARRSQPQRTARRQSFSVPTHRRESVTAAVITARLAKQQRKAAWLTDGIKRTPAETQWLFDMFAKGELDMDRFERQPPHMPPLGSPSSPTAVDDDDGFDTFSRAASTRSGRSWRSGRSVLSARAGAPQPPPTHACFHKGKLSQHHLHRRAMRVEAAARLEAELLAAAHAKSAAEEAEAAAKVQTQANRADARVWAQERAAARAKTIAAAEARLELKAAAAATASLKAAAVEGTGEEGSAGDVAGSGDGDTPSIDSSVVDAVPLSLDDSDAAASVHSDLN